MTGSSCETETMSAFMFCVILVTQDNRLKVKNFTAAAT